MGERDNPSIERDDLVSATRLAGLLAVKSYKPNCGCTLRSWVITKMRYGACEHLRECRRQVGGGRGRAERGLVVHWVNWEDMQESPCVEIGPEAWVLYEDMLRRLRLEVEVLPGPLAHVIRLRYWELLTYKQAGARMGVHETRAFQLHREALARLRAWLTEEMT